MSAARKIDDAQRMLEQMRSSGADQDSVTSFVQTIQAAYDALLDEYSKKFGCKAGHTSLSKFKANAKKLSNVDAIRFLIWYEREFRAVRNDPGVGFLLDIGTDLSGHKGITESCSALLEKTRRLVYHAYENF